MTDNNNEQPIIICRDVHKWYGNYHALRGINMEVKKGEVIADGGVGPDYRPVLPTAWCSLSTIPDTCLGPVSVEGPRAVLAG